MRSDMKHVIIDRPRAGGEGGRSRPPKGTRNYLQRTPLEDQPKYESSAPGRCYGLARKHLNEQGAITFTRRLNAEAIGPLLARTAAGSSSARQGTR